MWRTRISFACACRGVRRHSIYAPRATSAASAASRRRTRVSILRRTRRSERRIWGGSRYPTPLPPPVPEGDPELLLQQQVRRSPEGQNRPSKGLTAKFFLAKDLTVPTYCWAKN